MASGNVTFSGRRRWFFTVALWDMNRVVCKADAEGLRSKEAKGRSGPRRSSLGGDRDGLGHVTLGWQSDTQGSGKAPDGTMEIWIPSAEQMLSRENGSQQGAAL